MKRIWFRIFFVALAVFIGGIVYHKVIFREAPYVPYISDEDLNWDSVTQIEVYAVDWTAPPSQMITDEEEIKELVNTVRNTDDYEEVPKERRYKGLMSHWIRFDNGVVIGIYDSLNYGYIGTELSPTGSAPFYYVPLEVFDRIRELAAESIG